MADFWSDHISKYLSDPNALEKANGMYSEIRDKQGYDAAEAMLNNCKVGKFKQTYDMFAIMELAQSNGLQYMHLIK